VELTTLEDSCRGIYTAMGVEIIEKRLSNTAACAEAIVQEANRKFLKSSSRPF
jgi:hypothetical protein